MPVILVSACLLGRACRYNGAACYHPQVAHFCRQPGLFCLAICPETLGGLPTPRSPAEIQGGNGYDVLAGRARVLTVTGRDVSPAFVRGAERALCLAKKVGALAALLKARSPSCGKDYVYDGSFRHTLRPGPGVTTALLAAYGLPVFSEEELPYLRRFLGSRYHPATSALVRAGGSGQTRPRPPRKGQR